MPGPLKRIVNFFIPDRKVMEVVEITSGHINDTMLVTMSGGERFVFQRINKNVFADIPGLIMNKVKISDHLHRKLADLPEHERRRRALTFLKSKGGSYYKLDDNGDFWHATYFIEGSRNFETVNSSDVAYEGGRLFGSFIRQTQDMDPNDLLEVIPHFHDMSFRFEQFDEALKKGRKDRIQKAETLIKLARDLQEEMTILENLKNAGRIRVRVTHNDTKISNALFDSKGKGLCVIDTDTVMPGIVHYDFGDAIRTICNSSAEDEIDLSKVTFNKEFYSSYSKGYLEALGNTVSDFEIDYFPLAAKTMIFIMALRFLTDYLNSDRYYKTSYPEHNLTRSRNQFKLLKSFEEQSGNMGLNRQ